MKLTVRQKPFARRLEYAVTDGAGREVCRLLGDDFTGRVLRLADTRGESAAEVRIRRRRGLTKFQVEHAGKIFTMRQRLTWLDYRFVGEDAPWVLAVNFTGRRFTLREGADGPVRMTARKRWLCWGDCFDAELAPGADPILCLALLLGAGRR